MSNSKQKPEKHKGGVGIQLLVRRILDLAYYPVHPDWPPMDDEELEREHRQRPVDALVSCPHCGNETEDISLFVGNGVLGPGHHSRKTVDLRVCKKCRIVISPKD